MECSWTDYFSSPPSCPKGMCFPSVSDNLTPLNTLTTFLTPICISISNDFILWSETFCFCFCFLQRYLGSLVLYYKTKSDLSQESSEQELCKLLHTSLYNKHKVNCYLNHPGKMEKRLWVLKMQLDSCNSTGWGTHAPSKLSFHIWVLHFLNSIAQGHCPQVIPQATY